MDKGLMFDDAVKVLERYGRVSWSGDSNAASAQCVAHDDGRPSLSVKRGEDGRALVHCFAGCDWRDVLDRLKALAAPDVKISERQQQEIRTRAKPKETSGARGGRPTIRWAINPRVFDQRWGEVGPIEGEEEERL